MKQEIKWGLTACGCSGETSINIDESISGPHIYELEISKPKWVLRFRIDNTNVVIELLNFLRNKNTQKFQIGLFNGLKVNIYRDIEFMDRFFINIIGASGTIHYTIGGDTAINELIVALEQTIEELQ